MLDLYEQWTVLEKTGQFRFTPPTHALVAFHQALKEHAQQGGVAARGARYRRNADVLVKGMREHGLRDAARGRRKPARSSRPSSRRAIPISISSASTRRCAQRGYAIYPGKLTKRPSFRIGTIGQIDETVMQRRARRHPGRAART